nr:DNA mismatch repair protein MutS [uncultured Caproiciproducens sp.]
MTFRSILFEKMDDCTEIETEEEPACFTDLNLDQIVASVTAGKDEYNLKPFFYVSLKDVDTIKYRQEIMKELENIALFEYVKVFAQEMHNVRSHLALADKLYYHYNKQGWFLVAAGIYCGAVNGLARDLFLVDLKSRGFLAFREYINDYIKSDSFTTLMSETEKLEEELSTVKYCLLIKGNCVKVRKYESEIDYSIDVEKTFEKFKQGEVNDYRIKFLADKGMHEVESKALDLVAKLYPKIFMHLDNFCSQRNNFIDSKIKHFDREIQFYISYLEYISTFKNIGLKFCYPTVSEQCKEIYDNEGFDLALANKLISQKSAVVCNDFYLKDKERIIVISGPNQGGKTTFARAFGQLHYLAGLGCPVPGSDARLFLFDRIYTHFEREEDIKNLSGKLQDDLIRIHDILNQATPKSIIIMNEIFSSTTLKDAILLGRKVIEKIMELDTLCVCVTFVDELASLGEKTVSMASTIVPKNPAQRTYKIVRKPADGLAYALSIAEKYQLTYVCIKGRIKS